MRSHCNTLLVVFSLFLVQNTFGGEIPPEMRPDHERAVAAIDAQGGEYYSEDTRMHFVSKPSHADLTKSGEDTDYSVLNDLHGLDMVTLPSVDGTKLNAINNPALRVVIFYGGTFSDEAFLDFLDRHPKLEALNFFSPPTNLTSKAVASLGSLEHLDYIQMQGVPITDEGIAALPESVTKINITGSGFTPQCFEAIAKLSNLERLRLVSLKGIKDEDVAKLKRLSKLKSLAIKESDLTAVGLEHLSHLTSLEHLTIGGRGISDHGLRHLQGLKRLKQLFLYNTRCTKAGLDQLRKDIWGPEGRAAFVRMNTARRTSRRR